MWQYLHIFEAWPNNVSLEAFPYPLVVFSPLELGGNGYYTPTHSQKSWREASFPLSLHPWAKLRSLFPFSLLTPLGARCLPGLYPFQQQMSSMRPPRRSPPVLLVIHTDPLPHASKNMRLCRTLACWGFFLFFSAVTLSPDPPSTFSVSVVSERLYWRRLLPASEGGGKKSSKALAHIRVPDLCQYLFSSWSGSKSNTCYGGSGCCIPSRCCGWSSVAGYKRAVWHASTWGFETEAVKWKAVCTELSP